MVALVECVRRIAFFWGVKVTMSWPAGWAASNPMTRTIIAKKKKSCHNNLSPPWLDEAIAKALAARKATNLLKGEKDAK